jgi:tetratricopeptide (TPR) repeat protein
MRLLRAIQIFLSFLLLLSGCASAENKIEIEKPEETADAYFENSQYSFSHSQNRFLKNLENEEKKDVDMLFKIANSFYDSENYSQAEKLYLDILKIKPDYRNSAAAQFNLGLIAMKKNNWREGAQRFSMAKELFFKPEDIRDSWLLLMECLRNDKSWQEVINESDSFLKDIRISEIIDEGYDTEAGLRKAEALIMTDRDDEGKRLADYLIHIARKGRSRSELMYNPNYAYGNFILGVLESKKFYNEPLVESEESLYVKCKTIIDAQSYFLVVIQTGVIYWTNASAFEISRLYTTLYQEMISIPVPDDLSEEEIKVYECELWKRISGLLTRPRRYLKRSIEAAEKINEENQYTAKSFELLRKIEELYEKRKKECEDY